MLRKPSCGAQNLPRLERGQILTATPFPPRCFRHRRRFGGNAPAGSRRSGSNPSLMKKRACPKGQALSWRRRRDLNPRAGFPTYSLSRGAPSPLGYFSMVNYHENFCSSLDVKWRRGRDSNSWSLAGSLVFKTSSLNHSDTSPCLARVIYYHKGKTHVNGFRKSFLSSRKDRTRLHSWHTPIAGRDSTPHNRE